MRSQTVQFRGKKVAVGVYGTYTLVNDNGDEIAKPKDVAIEAVFQQLNALSSS